MSKSLAILGTSSSVGKTTITMALCSYFTNKNLNVSPFKAFNLSNEGFVHNDNIIGYAQYLQSLACNKNYNTNMNPILKSIENNKPLYYINGKKENNVTISMQKEIVQNSFNKVLQNSELVIVEGSGSMLELNLLDYDIANLNFCVKNNIPIILVTDISKGGCFGNLYGHISLLNEKERSFIKGIIINKFDGEPSSFNSGVSIIEDICKVKVLGVVPNFNINLPEEDSISNCEKVTDLTYLNKEIKNISDLIIKNINTKYLDTVVQLT